MIMYDYLQLSFDVFFLSTAALAPIYLVLIARVRLVAWKKKLKLESNLIAQLAITLILIFGALCSIPNVFSKSGIFKTMAHEAAANLRSIYAAQEAYHARYNEYAGGPDAFKLLAWKPAVENMNYSYACGDDYLASIRQGNAVFQYPSQWPFKIRPRSGRDNFICMAFTIYSRGMLSDIWMINQDNEMVHLKDFDGQIIDMNADKLDLRFHRLRELIVLIKGEWLWIIPLSFAAPFWIVGIWGIYWDIKKLRIALREKNDG